MKHNATHDKRVAVLSDPHCGHVAGLTPPEYAYAVTDDRTKHDKFAIIQDVTWRWFYAEAVKIRPVDVLLLNGDAIDGRGEKAGGVECITTDRTKQCEMAIRVIKVLQPKHVILTYGTTYHVASSGEEWEGAIAKTLADSNTFSGDVAVGAHEWFSVNGVVFDAKHHVAMGAAPQTQFSSITRDSIWQMLWAMRREAPRANIIIRSHLHTYLFAKTSDFTGIVTPGLQAYSKYGAKQVSRTIDYGFLHFDVTKEGNWTCVDHLARFAEFTPTVLKF